MSRIFKNKINMGLSKVGNELREEMINAPFEKNTLLPKTLEYRDIDEAFIEWVKKDLSISFEGKELPTVSLFTNQRFSEYMQSWEEVDDKKNFLMNFKIVTRENNPQQGSLYGEARNIPGDRFYTIHRIHALDKVGRPYFIDYKMKQPFCVDITYRLSIVTNKYTLLNDFNTLLNDKFKSIQCFIRPNGYYVEMKLENVSDESEYNIDDREYYSQSYDITVPAYIITEDSLKVEENPVLKFRGFEGEAENTAYADIEESEDELKNYYTISAFFGARDKKLKFTMDVDCKIESILTDNVSSYSVLVNDTLIQPSELPEYELENGDIVKLTNIVRKKIQPSTITLKCYKEK